MIRQRPNLTFLGGKNLVFPREKGITHINKSISQYPTPYVCVCPFPPYTWGVLGDFFDLLTFLPQPGLVPSPRWAVL